MIGLLFVSKVTYKSSCCLGEGLVNVASTVLWILFNSGWLLFVTQSAENPLYLGNKHR